MKKTSSIFVLVLITAVLVAPASTHEDPTCPMTAFDRIIPHYEAIHEALVADSIEGIAAHAESIVSVAGLASKDLSAQKAGVSEPKVTECRKILPEISRASGNLAAAQDLTAAREAFGQLSQPLVRYREMVSGEKPKVAYCPMAKKPWLQEGTEIANPYYGSSMLRCGSIVSE